MTEKIITWDCNVYNMYKIIFFSEWASFTCGEYYALITSKQKPQTDKQKKRGQSLTEGTDEGQIYSSMTLSGWKKLYMLSIEPTGWTPCSWQQAFGRSIFFPTAFPTDKGEGGQSNADEMNVALPNHAQIFVTWKRDLTYHWEHNNIGVEGEKLIESIIL